MPKRYIAVGVVALALSACGGQQTTPSLPSSDPGLIHAHGLGVDPADGSLFIATHTGLFRSAERETTATRVGRAIQDTMGFTVIGPRRFVGSGHPDPRSGKPPLLGLIESRDAGTSWRSISLQGKADFHVLRAAGPDIVGYDSIGNRLLRLTMAGRITRLKKPRGTVIDLVVDPRDDRHFVAATDTGLYESTDAGRRWSQLEARRTGLLAYLPSGGLTLVRGDGVVERRTGEGGWSQLATLQGRPGALGSYEDTLYLAVQEGPVLRSTDGGRRWEQRVAAE